MKTLTIVAKALLNGGTMVRNGNFGYRIRDSNVNPVAKISDSLGAYIKLKAKSYKGAQKGQKLICY